MSRLDLPALPPPPPDGPDHLDRAFAAYFKRELPNPWPAARATAAVQPANARPALGGTRSRLTLAASVAALLGLGLYAASDPVPPAGVPVPPAGPSVNSGVADGSGLKTKMDQADPPAGPMGPMGLMP